MLLRTSLSSPFGRKTRMAAARLGLLDKMDVVNADTVDPADPIRKDNPLGKIPALVLDNGQCIYDSRVILDYFDHAAGGGKIIPADWDGRLAAMRQQALGDGMMDAAVLIVYEARFRPQEMVYQQWIDRQREKLERSLAALAAGTTVELPDPETFTVGSLTLACALGYIDLRKQVDWRGQYPVLVQWLDDFAAATPEFTDTHPPG